MANALVCEPSRFPFAGHQVPSLEVSAPLILGERVVWIHDDNLGPEHGTVRWIGKLPEMGQDWVAGVELDNPAGKHDGRWGNRQLFLTKPKHGLVIPVMGLIKEEEFIGHPQTSDSTMEQANRGLPPDPPGWYDNVEYHNAHRVKRESQFWKRLRNKKSGKSEIKKRQPQPESAALQVAASIAAGDVPTAVTPRSRAKTQTVRSDLGVELDKWYEATDFSGARQCKKKSNTLAGSSSVKSFDETEVSSLASYGATADESSRKLKGGFMSFFRWLRPKKAEKKKSSSPYLPSPSLSEGSRVKSGSAHSVTSTSSSFQYVAMDFSQSRSVSNAPTLEAKPPKGSKVIDDKDKKFEEKQRNDGMKSVVNELRVKLTPSSNNAVCKSDKNNDKIDADELQTAAKLSDPNELEEKEKASASADEILVDADYANVSPLPKTRGVVRRKKRRAPPPPPLLLKSGGSNMKTEGGLAKSSVSASPGAKRGAHVKGKRRAPSPPLQSTPKPWARFKDGKKNMSVSGVESGVKEKAESNIKEKGGNDIKEKVNLAVEPIDVEKPSTPGPIKSPKMADAETNTTLFRSTEKAVNVAVPTNTTLIRPQAEMAVAPPTQSTDINCNSQELSKGPLSEDIPFCDEVNEDTLVITDITAAVTDDIPVVSDVEVKTKDFLGPCSSCGEYWCVPTDTNKMCTSHLYCPKCFPKIVNANQRPQDQSLSSTSCDAVISNSSKDETQDDEDFNLSNPFVTDEWKETPRSTQNLISMFNAMSYCFEADKWRMPGSMTPTAESEKLEYVTSPSPTSENAMPTTIVTELDDDKNLIPDSPRSASDKPEHLREDSSPSSTSESTVATTIIEELDDEKWLANVDAEFARLSDAYLQSADQNTKGSVTHEMTFSEICSDSPYHMTPEPSTGGDTQSQDSIIINRFKADSQEEVLPKDLSSEGEHTKKSSSVESFESKMVNNRRAGMHERALPIDSIVSSEQSKTWGSARSCEAKIVKNNSKEGVHERTLSKDSITGGELPKTWSSAESFEDARDTMTPSIEDYKQWRPESSKSGNISEESSFSIKEKQSKSYEVNNPVYSNIPLPLHSKPIPKPRYSEMAKPSASNVYASHVLYQNVFPETCDAKEKGGLSLQDHTKSTFNGVYANYVPPVGDYSPETPDLIRNKCTPTIATKLEGKPTYANINVECQSQGVGEKKEIYPVDCEMFHEEKRMQSRMKMNRRIFKEAKSRNQSSSQESDTGILEANHTADACNYYRRNRSVSASSSSSPILSSASSVSSALNSPPALPKKIGPIRERRRRSHPVPATISEDGPPKPVKNRSHVRENSGLTTLPTRMPSASVKSSSSVEELDENKGILVGSLLLQIASKDGPQPSGLSLVTGSSLPRDSGNNHRAPIPLPDKKNRKKNTIPSTVCNVVANPVEFSNPRDNSSAVVMRRRKDHGGPTRMSEQRRTVGNNLPGHCSSNTPCSVQVPDEHEYYNIRVHTGEGCKLQVRRAHTLDTKSSSGHHHHHHHRQNPRGREKKGRVQKSFASVAADSPLGKVTPESRVSEPEWDGNMSQRVTSPNAHFLNPTNAPLSHHFPCIPGCAPSKYNRSFSDPDPISLSQTGSTSCGFQNERSSKPSRLQGQTPGKTSTQPVLVTTGVGKQSETRKPSENLHPSNGGKLNITVPETKHPDILTSNSCSPRPKESADREPQYARKKESTHANRKSENIYNNKDLHLKCNDSNKSNESKECNLSQLPPTGVYGRLTCKLNNESLTTNNNPSKKIDMPADNVNCLKPPQLCEEILPNKNEVKGNVSGQQHRPLQQQTRDPHTTSSKVSPPKSSPHFNDSPTAVSPKTVTDSSRQKPAALANNSLSRSPKMLKAEPKKQPAVVMPEHSRPPSKVALVHEQAKFAGRLWPASYEVVAPELLRLRLKLSGIVNGSHDEEISGDTNTLEVNKLLRKLEVSIASGHIDEAAILARKLAMLKVNCSVIRNKPRIENTASEEICLNLFVEDRTSHIGPINLCVNPSMTVGDLKKKIENNFDFPSNLQRWILGKKLASDDNLPLSDFDIRTSGCPVFLYLMTSDQDIANAYKQRLESYLKALEELDLEDDFSDDEVTSGFLKEQDEHPHTLSGDNTRVGNIPTEEQNGHHIEYHEGRVSRSGPPHQGRQNINAADISFAGARPKQQPNSTASRDQENGIPKEEGWNCPACTMFNVPTRPGCVVCTTARPENYIVPKEYVPRPEEQERLLKERQLELDLEQAREKERLENYQRLLAVDDMDVVLNDEAFECPVCFTDVDVGEGIRVRDCLHVFCRDCLARSVEYSETAEVKCPFRDNDYSCPNVLQHREIQALVTQEVYDRHLQKSVTTAESQAENSFHCKTANCPAWCYFEDNINEFPCTSCGHVNCLTCQAIHEELNCKQYQDKVDFEAATNDAARKTKEALDEMLAKGQAMRCPKCQVILMKKWGCDWICCSMCKTEICWVTKGPRWGPAGQGDTSGGCRCGVNGVRCHTQCNYCH